MTCGDQKFCRRRENPKRSRITYVSTYDGNIPSIQRRGAVMTFWLTITGPYAICFPRFGMI
jgi:hypothetical protein